MTRWRSSELGTERRILLSPEERKRTAHHEGGHALLCMLTPDADPVRKVSIILGGIALGVTLAALEAHRFSCERPYDELLGDSAADDEITTGAQNDTKQARALVPTWSGCGE